MVSIWKPKPWLLAESKGHRYFSNSENNKPSSWNISLRGEQSIEYVFGDVKNQDDDVSKSWDFLIWLEVEINADNHGVFAMSSVWNEKK